MNMPTLPTLLSAFFLRYLAVERGVSPHTTTSYRDAMKLLLQFAAVRCRCSVDQLVIEELTVPLVLDFLADLETSRGNTIRTRNSGLAAVQTFFRYVAGREPALAATCSPVLAIPGERDYVLLSILYDTGARIQELLDLSPRDFHLDSPPFVCVRGKGRRERLCPLLPQSARLVRQFLSAEGRQLNEQQPFLQNGRGGRLGRHGARYILVKYLRRAARSMPALSRVGISPHTMRHTKAMHLLQSGVPLVMVKDFLGHADMKSTEVYVQADLDMKRKALDSSNGPQTTQAPTPRLSSSLIEWLEAL